MNIQIWDGSDIEAIEKGDILLKTETTDITFRDLLTSQMLGAT